MLNMYARLMKAGIPMEDIDRMDVLRYLDVLAYEQDEGDKVIQNGTMADIFG